MRHGDWLPLIGGAPSLSFLSPTLPKAQGEDVGRDVFYTGRLHIASRTVFLEATQHLCGPRVRASALWSLIRLCAYGLLASWPEGA